MLHCSYISSNDTTSCPTTLGLCSAVVAVFRADLKVLQRRQEEWTDDQGRVSRAHIIFTYLVYSTCEAFLTVICIQDRIRLYSPHEACCCFLLCCRGRQNAQLSRSHHVFTLFACAAISTEVRNSCGTLVPVGYEAGAMYYRMKNGVLLIQQAG